MPFGSAFRDASDRQLVVDGLEVRIADAALPRRTALLSPKPSGTWMTPRLPGLNATLAGAPADWPANTRDFDLTVTDHITASCRRVSPRACRSATAMPDRTGPGFTRRGSAPCC